MREHVLHGVGDVLRRVGGIEKPRRGALLQLGGNARNDRIDLAVFIAREARIHGVDRRIGNVENRDRNSAILEGRAKGGSIFCGWEPVQLFDDVV